MKNANITIGYDEEKLKALKRYLLRKDLSLEEELKKTTEKLYARHVPAAVQDYIEESQVAGTISYAKQSKPEKEELPNG